MPANEQKALRFAVRYGIMDYKVRGNQMIYREYFGQEIYEAKVNLKTMEETRKQIK